VKLSRRSVRSRSSVSSSKVDKAIDSSTSISVPRRCQALCAAIDSRAFMAWT
jgi:hypothetical protein